MLTVGGIGVVSVASHLVGESIQEMIQAFTVGKTARAVELNVKLFQLFKVLFCTTNPIPVKAALNKQGWQVGGLRLPLSPLQSELYSPLEAIMQDLGLL
jgi:4-hydroxy-tetrahydrodipicolinate synthase